MIIHINGWPGTGKLTIARLLAKQLNGRLLDNHTLINPADSLFHRDEPHYWPLRHAVRALVLEYAARVSPGVPLVCTNALADIPSDRAQFEAYRELAGKRAARLIAVTLECELEENVSRLTAPGRADLRKLTKAHVLRDARAGYRLYRPDELTCIDLDVTALSAEEAAAALVGLLADGCLRPGDAPTRNEAVRP